MRWSVALGAASILGLCSLLLARQGVVTTSEGQTFEGDINDKGTTVDVVTKGGTLTLKKPNVKSIVFADELDQLYAQKAAALDKNDLQGHIDLAQWGMDNHAFEQARGTLEEARTLDPSNLKVQAMLEKVNAQIHNRPNPATAPATQPGEVARTDANPTTVPAELLPVKPKPLTPEQINIIRQLEWAKDEPGMRIRLENDVKRKFIAYTNEKISDFNRLSVQEQAWRILQDGTKDMRKDVKIVSDPAATADYKKSVQRFVLAGCAASACHGSEKGGRFFLYNPSDNDSTTYTNYLILQSYSQNLQGRQYLMVDRQHPDNSLLLNFMLPPELGVVQHPGKSFHGFVRNKDDLKYQQILKWMGGTLSAVTPDYRAALAAGAAPANTPANPATRPAQP